MTVKEKIAQANFFRMKVNESSIGKYETNEKRLFETAAYYSAYLNASASVLDYLLYYANKSFRLNLKDEEHWTIKDFEKKAKSIKNWGAWHFAQWYKSAIDREKGMSIGSAFAECRRIDTHKRPTYDIGFNPTITKATEPDNIMMDSNIFLTVQGDIQKMRIEDACDTHYSTLEAFVIETEKKIEEIQVQISSGKLEPPSDDILNQIEKEKKLEEMKKNRATLDQKIDELEKQ